MAVPRWEPKAEERLVLAALDLYATRGYDGTTISDIASHAGVTSRTYFRYFPDKREVLFGGADRLRDRIAAALHDAPQDMQPLPACVHALAACEDLFRSHEHEQLRRRDAVISGSGELQERETRKLASIGDSMTAGLVQRGSDQEGARLAADLAVVIFQRAARLWMADPATRYADMVGRAASEVRRVLAV